MLGTFGFTYSQRAFYGAEYRFGPGDGVRRPLLTLAAMSPSRGAFSVDGWGFLKTAVGYASLTGQGERQDWRVFTMIYDDWRPVTKIDDRPLALRAADHGSIRIASYGGHWLRGVATPAGEIDVLAWGVLQQGKWGVLDHSASALALESGWQVPVRVWKPWIRVGYFRSSGDRDPNDGRHTTFFQGIPNPGPFAKNPFFNLMNSTDVLMAARLHPTPRLVLKPEFHWLRLTRPEDLWLHGGGASTPWSFGYTGRPSGGSRDLARLVDVGSEWKVNPRLTLCAYIGVVQGGRVVRSVYPDNRYQRFGFLEASWTF